MTETGRDGKGVPGRWYDQRAPVLVILFLVLGAFGLPILWRSSGFSQREKALYTVLTVLYTLLLVAIAVWIIVLVPRLLLKLLSTI